MFEYVERNLLEVLEQRPNGLDPETVRRYIWQLVRAISWCHRSDIVHRDIKPENLLVDPESRSNAALKLCDFGFARALTRAKTEREPLTDYVATRWYRAPELLLGSDAYGFEVDQWAIGCIMGELIDGQPLFPGESDVDQLYIVQKHMGPLTDEQRAAWRRNPRFAGTRFPKAEGVEPKGIHRKYAGKVSESGLRFMKELLRMDPRERLTWHGMLTHPFFEGMEGYDARAPSGPNGDRARGAEKSVASAAPPPPPPPSPKSKPLTPEEEEEKRRKARARENAMRLRREREAAEAEAREREEELRMARERAREELEREARAAKERRRREREREEMARVEREEREERERRAAAAAAERARAERDRERDLERPYFGFDDFPPRRAAAEPPSRVGRRGGLFPSDPDRDPPSSSAADPARLPRISRLDARRSRASAGVGIGAGVGVGAGAAAEIGSVARGSRRVSRREISADAFADDLPRVGTGTGTGMGRRAGAASDEAFGHAHHAHHGVGFDGSGLGLRGYEFGAASRRGERRAVAGRRSDRDRDRDRDVGDAEDLGLLLNASKIGSREPGPRAAPRRTSEADSGLGLGFPGALPPAREGRRAGLPRGAGGDLGVGTGKTRRGVGLGAGAGGARPQLRFGGGDAGGGRGGLAAAAGGFDRSKYVVPPVPTYEERRRMADARGEAGWR